MRQLYIERNFTPKSLELIEKINAMIENYVEQGFRLTVRQLYYQLVQSNAIPNTERSYKNTCSLVNDARLAGVMDWDAIEDRTRSFIRLARWKNGAQRLRAAADGFHMDMWHDQEWRVFAMVEKEALAGVLEGICMQYDVPLLACKGYPSVSVLREPSGCIRVSIPPRSRASHSPASTSGIAWIVVLRPVTKRRQNSSCSSPPQ